MSGASKWLPQFLGETGLWWVLTAGVWLATLSARTPAELAVLAGCMLPVAVLARSARRTNAGRWRFRIGWLVGDGGARHAATGRWRVGASVHLAFRDHQGRTCRGGRDAGRRQRKRGRATCWLMPAPSRRRS
ncbi:hypothetical protein B1T51_23495 [Mycobacterium kansasii]|uniref:Uncharacterized protein n=1 Tax=Mycobacterium kansasii ATCC 12478 TaxID=557599 RepID=U5WVX4_MYCKA|nr:hypothetical protein MKAN_24355 [Mycobacterium kansasii ATCC 12478]ARG68425.1 hypothetical protein B1T47_04550 [Mycobacterium kansasii]ARG76935.1 hypothetical protein B1T51_23495 [Mycobacterium kansasii]ARG82468.1 hypothetical protein B1T52_23885 [Mycobacterium kansasii]ARG94552.1 hypothetical protein B1T50_24345 [Mycobacterium kansasii]